MTDKSVENTTYVPNEGDVDALKALFRNTQGEILQIVVEAYWDWLRNELDTKWRMGRRYVKYYDIALLTRGRA